MQGKVEYYNKNKKEQWSPLICHNDIVCGFWWFGRWYKTSRTETGEYFYGAYPLGFLPRIQLFFNKEFKGRLLHLFSGTLKGDSKDVVTFDINPKLNPNVLGDAEKLSDYFVHGDKFNLILADPPYENNYIKYGTKKISRKKVINQCSKLIAKDGFLVWMDTLIPQWTKGDGWIYKGSIGIAQSTNHRVRALTILRKD